MAAAVCAPQAAGLTTYSPRPLALIGIPQAVTTGETDLEKQAACHVAKAVDPVACSTR